MAEGDVFLTKQGYEDIKKEYEQLKNVRRREISDAIEKARALGDLKENAEYAAAKEAMSLNEKRIAEFEAKISRARIIDNEAIDSDKALIGATVKLLCLDDNEEEEYMLVSEAEADFSKNKISTTSPIGKAILGCKKGEKLDIAVPNGTIKYEIIDISR